MSYLLSFTFFALTGLSYYLQIPQLLMYVFKRTRSIKNTKPAEETTMQLRFNMLCIALTLLYNCIVESIKQKFSKSVKKLDKHTYEISYIINGVFYKYVTKVKRGPPAVMQIINTDTDEDITYDVYPYLGPLNNFHGQVYNSKFFNCKNMCFNMANGDTLYFTEEQPIVF